MAAGIARMRCDPARMARRQPRISCRDGDGLPARQGGIAARRSWLGPPAQKEAADTQVAANTEDAFEGAAKGLSTTELPHEIQVTHGEASERGGLDPLFDRHSGD